MKKIIILIVLFCVIFISGCTHDNEIVGKYQYSEKPPACLELKDDGRYVVDQDNAFSGDYVYDEKSVTLIYTFGSYTLIRDGPDLIDEFNVTWKKINKNIKGVK